MLKKGKNSTKGGKKAANASIIEQSMSRYQGPVKPVLSKLGFSTVKKFACNAGAFVTTVGGSGSGSYTLNPGTSALAIADWSSWAATYSEYRLLAACLHFVPAFQSSYPTSTAVGGTIAMFVDRDNGTSALSLSQILENEGSKFCSINQPLSVTFKMLGTNEAQFVNTASPISPATIRFTTSSLSASTTYGIFILEWLLEGRQAE